jgi:superfamily II DNA or RNA helicase
MAQTTTTLAADLAATVYDKLKAIRSKKDLSARASKYLKPTFTALDGTERPLKLRYYQVQGVMHLLAMKRFLLGDDTGLGKTIMAIAALCYLWERTPDTKVVILTTKSATEQWRDEFVKFTIGIKVFVCRGTPVQRRKARDEYERATGPAVLIMGYRSAVQDFSDLQNWSGYVFITDECFDYHTPILLEDGTTELIGRIVSKKMPVRVLSWNPSTGLVEPKTVTNWFRNPLIAGKRKDLRRVSFRYSGNVRVTGSHEFHTPSGKTPVYKLRVGSPVFHYTTKIPSETQWQVLLGSLLGDSSIANPNRNLSGMSFGHCEKQRDLLAFKHGVLSSLGVSEINWGINRGYPKKDGTEKLHGRFTLDGNPSLSQFIDSADIRREGKKRVTTEWLDRIGPLGMAVWYADDGSLNSHINNDGTTSYYVNISTHGFTREDHEVMVGWLRWRWGIRAEVKTARATGSGRKTYSYLHLNRDASELFFALLPGSIPGVEYKFPVGMSLVDVASDLSPGWGLVEDSITGLDRWSPQPNHKYVYDIEVEGNHNYFANGTLVSNCTAYKTPSTQVHQVCHHLSSKAERTWALTATLIKNSLIEGWGIYRVVAPGLFGNKNSFLNEYCIIRMQSIPGSRRQIPIIVGYRERDVKVFRDKIDPYFLGRPKFEVASELPPLVIRNIKCMLTSFQQEKYAEALSGLLEIGKDDKIEEKEVTKLTAVTYCQQIVNHPELIGCDGDSDKLDTLIDLLTEGELADEKVIVFSRFRKMVDILIPALKKAKIQAVRITGSEDEKERNTAQDAFQDPNSKTHVVCITTAGAEAINLQAAKAIIFYDTPWSGGDYIQILGRMIRIGSLHDRCYALHLVAEGTIDDRVVKVMGNKMNLIEKVLGKRIKGETDPDTVVAVENDLSDLFNALVQDAKRG